MPTFSAEADRQSDPDVPGGWAVVDDPAAWRRFVADVIARHHRVSQPGAVADQCSCGRPFMLCSIAPLADHLVRPAPPPGAPEYWMG